MKHIKQIIPRKLFINAFYIIKKYLNKQSYIPDLNLRLIHPYINLLDEKIISKYYNRYLKTEILFLNPELFITEPIFVPKKLTSVREYRFFTTYSYILYTAIGLVFIEICEQLINEVNFARKNVKSISPTRFSYDGLNWSSINEYKIEYKKFLHELDGKIKPGNAVLTLDISDYFGSIQHTRLINILLEYSKQSTLTKHNIDKDAVHTLEFYFEALMGKKHSIPQGKKNFVSDYLGYLYLVPFDLAISDILKSEKVKFKCFIRYVDDIVIVFEINEGVSKKSALKEILRLEQEISSWLLNNLSLQTNSDKTTRQIIENEAQKIEFIKKESKAVSSNEKEEVLNETINEIVPTIDDEVDKFLSALAKFQFKEENKFSFSFSQQEKENLKLIFESRISNILLKTENIIKINQILEEVDIELTSDFISILAVLFLKRKRGRYIFSKTLLKKIKNNTEKLDKKHIHILVNLLSDKSKASFIHTLIKKQKQDIEKDDYGKFLMLSIYKEQEIQKLIDDSKKFNGFMRTSIYTRILNEFNSKNLSDNFISFDINLPYILFLEKLDANRKIRNKAAIQQLKFFISYILQEKYHIAFNHFHNAFHEICKIKFSMRDNETVKDLLKKIVQTFPDLSIKDEILILKFYDRRNFNTVSHPSHKEEPSTIVTIEEFNFYVTNITILLLKIL